MKCTCDIKLSFYKFFVMGIYRGSNLSNILQYIEYRIQYARRRMIVALFDQKSLLQCTRWSHTDNAALFSSDLPK